MRVSEQFHSLNKSNLTEFSVSLSILDDLLEGSRRYGWNALEQNPWKAENMYKVQGVFFNWAYPLDWPHPKMLRRAPPLTF